jgi:hypothetical protein
MNFTFLYQKLMHHKILVFVLVLNLFPLVNNAEPADTTKLPLSINLSYIKEDNIKNVHALITRKVKRKNIPIKGVSVSLYFNEISNNSFIDSLVTNDMGEVIFIIPDKFYKLIFGKEENTFKARINNKQYEDVKEEITVKDAILSLSLIEKDSIKELSAKLFRKAEEKGEIPIPEIEIKFYVKTTFSLLPIGEELSTDENGIATTEIPLDLPADYQKTMTVIAKVKDDENYGTLETHLIIPWNVFPKNVTKETRSLWSSGKNAPVPLLIASITIILGVWSVLLYLIYQLFRIWKLGRPKQQTR